MKPLLPTLREKKRYLVFEVLSKENQAGALTLEGVRRAIEQASLGYLGELGCAIAGLQFLDENWDGAHSRGMLRVTHTSLDHARASLALVRQIDGKDVIVRSVGASGMVGRAKSRYLSSAGATSAARPARPYSPHKTQRAQAHERRR